MKLNDLYYRGLKLHSNSVEKDKDALKLRRVIRQANTENDKLETVKYICKIDEEWVRNIEEGMVYVEKALREERQFIRTEGEVVPIEKAKHTSKTTVEHLAKHSNFITHVPENPADDLVPDKLYIVEKESDYAVYENRFLYLLLTYLRDFLAIRLNKIRDKMTTYHGKYSACKDIHLSHRNLQYEVKLTDEIKDDPILVEKYKTIPMIDRVEMQYHLVLSFLSTPLMEQVSKAPMLKPPIIKTNTLKMNTNFKTSLALYDYISAYNTPGYTFEEEIIEMHPFNDETADGYADVVALNAFLTYKNANSLSKLLKKRYDQNEKEVKEQERILREEQLKRLRRQINESNMSYEEYLIILENHNRDLEKDSAELKNANKTIEELSKKIQELERKNQQLVLEAEDLNNIIVSKDELIAHNLEKAASDMLIKEQVHREEIKGLIAKHQSEIEKINQKHQNEIIYLNAKHDSIVNKINEEHQNNIENLKEKFEEEKNNVILEATKKLVEESEKNYGKYRKEIEGLNGNVEVLKANLSKTNENLDKALNDKKRLIADYEDKIYNLIKNQKEKENEILKQIEERENSIEKLNQRIERLVQERQFAEAQLHIIRVEQGKVTDEYDYTSQERFEELEHQFNAFKQLFKKEWNKTKKKIRAQAFAEVDAELKAEKENPQAYKQKVKEAKEQKAKAKEEAKEKKKKEKELLQEEVKEENNLPIEETVSTEDEKSLEETLENTETIIEDPKSEE